MGAVLVQRLVHTVPGEGQPDERSELPCLGPWSKPALYWQGWVSLVEAIIPGKEWAWHLEGRWFTGQERPSLVAGGGSPCL